MAVFVDVRVYRSVVWDELGRIVMLYQAVDGELGVLFDYAFWMDISETTPAPWRPAHVVVDR